MDSVLLPYQEAWVNDRSPVKVCVKSRRIGITWATAFEAVEVASLSPAEGGSDFWYQVYAEDDAKEFIQECAKWARAIDAVFECGYEEVDVGDQSGSTVLADGEKSIRVLSIRFASGNKIVGLSHSPRKLRGKQGVYCLDEAGYHDDIAAALEAAQAFRVWGGRVMVISTMSDDGDEFHRLVSDIESGKGHRAKYSLHRYTLTEAVRQGLYQRICQVNGQRWTEEAERLWVEELLSTEGAETEFMCVPRSSGGQYLPAAVVRECMTRDYPVIRFRAPERFVLQPEEERDRAIDLWLTAEVAPLLATLPKNKPHYLGEDFGRSRDLSVLAPGYLAQDLVLEVPFLLELDQVPYESQKRVALYLIDRLPRFSGAVFDATGNGAYLGEQALARYGEALIECCKLSEQWYAETLPKLRAHIHDRAIRIPSDIYVLEDLGKFQLVNGVPRLPKHRVTSKHTGLTRHGDAGVALACLVRATSKPGMAVRYEAVPKRRGHFGGEGIL